MGGEGILLAFTETVCVGTVLGAHIVSVHPFAWHGADPPRGLKQLPYMGQGEMPGHHKLKFKFETVSRVILASNPPHQSVSQQETDGAFEIG